jgi:hypothetical protein
VISLPLEDRIAAKLDVLIEGIADHKMNSHNREMLAKEVVGDLRALMIEVRDERA